MDISPSAANSFISIHAPRAGSDWFDVLPFGAADGISIHAPRAGSDDGTMKSQAQLFAISIHAPRAGSDDNWRGGLTWVGEFQSTLPVRGATGIFG